MSSTVAEPVSAEAERSELRAVMESHIFARSPTLTHLLSYLCEKMLAGETGQIKEYSIALEVFGRSSSFDQDADSIVRVQANRLRKRLAEYYSNEGATHSLRITIPVGQYIPVFEKMPPSPPPEPTQAAAQKGLGTATSANTARAARLRNWLLFAGLGVLVLAGVVALVARGKLPLHQSAAPMPQLQVAAESVGPPAGDEVRILAGSSRSYVDRAGKLWNADAYFSGGTPVRSSIQHIWRTQDPTIYRTSRQGDFSYSIPLKQGLYELHLHFAEMY